MGNIITVPKGRTKTVKVSLGRDVSTSEFSSDIREDRNKESGLIASWVIGFETDGTDGELIFTLDDLVTAEVDVTSGYMDIKEVKDGEPTNANYEPLEVQFVNVITP